MQNLMNNPHDVERTIKDTPISIISYQGTNHDYLSRLLRARTSLIKNLRSRIHFTIALHLKLNIKDNIDDQIRKSIWEERK